jgi:hypothetical protein
VFVKIAVAVILFSLVTTSCKKNNDETKQTDMAGIVNNEVTVMETSLVLEDNPEKQLEENFENKEPELEDFIKYIQLSNCDIVSNYSVPNINNKILGIIDDEYPLEEIKENTLRYIWGGFQINLRKDIPVNKKYILTAKNSKNEFIKDLELEKIPENNDWTSSGSCPETEVSEQLYYSYNDEKRNVIGFCQNIMFENKFWLIDGNDWKFIIKADKETILEQTLRTVEINALIFSVLDDNPFIISNLKYVNLFENYTYRIKKGAADIIVVYYSPDYGIYKPALYLIPREENGNDYTDISICWKNEILRGIYYFGLYKFNDLPTKEKTTAVFDFIGVR